MAEGQKQQILFTADAEVYKKFKQILSDRGMTPTGAFRRFMRQTIEEEEKRANNSEEE